MQKLIFILFSFLFSNSVLFAQHGFWDADSSRDARIINLIRSNVKSEIIYSSYGPAKGRFKTDDYDSIIYQIKGDSLLQTQFFVFKGKYPKLRKIAVYSIDGTPRFYRSFGVSYSYSDDKLVYYDKRGKAIREYAKSRFVCDPNNKDSLYLKESNSYDATGQPLKEETFDENGHAISRLEYSYHDGYLREVLTYSTMDWNNMPDSLDVSEMMERSKTSEIKLTRRTIHTIDSASRTKETLDYTGADTILAYKTLETFNKDWNIIKQESHSIKKVRNGDQLLTMTYNNLRQKIEQKSYHDNELGSITRYKYDSQGKLVLESMKVDGLEISRNEWKYDNKGNQLEEYHITRYEMKGNKPYESSHKTTRKFDTFGNIIEEDEYLFGTLSRIYEHYYTYK